MLLLAMKFLPINYQIPELSLVTLKVYDVLSNEIALLVNEEKSIGIYEVQLDATILLNHFPTIYLIMVAYFTIVSNLFTHVLVE